MKYSNNSNLWLIVTVLVSPTSQWWFWCWSFESASTPRNVTKGTTVHAYTFVHRKRHHQSLGCEISFLDDDDGSFSNERLTRSRSRPFRWLPSTPVSGINNYEKDPKTFLMSSSRMDQDTEEEKTSFNTLVRETSPIPNPTTESGVVRRVYETYEWKYNGNTYNINYRVELGRTTLKDDNTRINILLIHGFGANLNHYRYQYEALANAGYKVYGIDMLGFGASDKPTFSSTGVEYSYELSVQLATDFIRHQMTSTKSSKSTNTQWVVAGNSIGGLISLGVAERFLFLKTQLQEDAVAEPSDIPTIRGIVLFNCSGGMSGFRYEDVPWFVRPILAFVKNIVLGPTFGRKFYQNFKTKANVESILKVQGVYRNITNVDEELLDILLKPSDDDGAQDVFLQTFACEPGPTPESILNRLQHEQLEQEKQQSSPNPIPILAIWGKNDPWTPVDGGAHPGIRFPNYYYGNIESNNISSNNINPNNQVDHENISTTGSDHFELVILPNAGHCPHDEYPDKVNSIMISWMQAKVLRTNKGT